MGIVLTEQSAPLSRGIGQYILEEITAKGCIMLSQQCLMSGSTELLEGREEMWRTGYCRVVWCVALRHGREKGKYFVFVLSKDSSPGRS